MDTNYFLLLSGDTILGAAYQTALGKKNTLYASIAAAKTVSAVQKIVW